MDLYLTAPVPPFPTAVGANFATFTARQDISPQPLPIILPNQLRLGSKLEVKAEGEVSSTGTPTLVLGFYIGTIASVITTVIAESSALSFATAAAWPWRMEWRGIITAVGTGGTAVGMGNVEFGTSLTATTTAPIPITQALRTITWDTTIARAIGVCGTWSASSGSNLVKTLNSSVMLLN